MPCNYFSLNNQLQFTRVNEGTELFFNLSKAELLGNFYWDISTTIQQETFIDVFKSVLEFKKTTLFNTFDLSLNKWFEYTISPILNGISIYFEDITEHVTNQKNVIDSQNKLRAFLNSSTDSSVLIDKNFTIVEFNQTAEETTQVYYNKKLQHGSQADQYILEHLKDEFDNYIKKAFVGEITHVEKEFIFQFYKPTWFLVRFSPVFDLDQTIIGVSINKTDIDSKKRSELILQNQNDLFKKIAWQQAHEVRRPVANILGIINLINADKSILHKEIESEYLLNQLVKEAKILDMIIHEIAKNAGNKSE